jgi:hypothetical protein
LTADQLDLVNPIIAYLTAHGVMDLGLGAAVSQPAQPRQSRSKYLIDSRK